MESRWNPVLWAPMLFAMGCMASSTDDDDDGGDEEPTCDTEYQGGWPCNADKDALGDPGWDSTAELGAQVPRFVAVDQFGDQVELYDFAGHGPMVMIDMGTEWCDPCKALAAYLSDGDMSHLYWDQNKKTGEDEYYPWWKEEYEGLAEMVWNGELYWITILFSESESAGPSTQEDCEDWEAAFPNDAIPVLADTELTMHDWLGVTSYPVLNLLDSDMNLLAYATGGPYEALGALADLQ